MSVARFPTSLILKCDAVMRADGVYRLILNATLFPGMTFDAAEGQSYLRFSVVESFKTVSYLLKVSSVPVKRS